MNTISLIMLLAGGMSEVKLLVDYTDSGVMDDESIQKGYYALEILPLDKAAIVGATPHLKKLITSMARAAGKSKLIHFSKNRETAIDWLKK